MIEKFRKSVNTTVAKILLGLLAIAFVFLWGGQEGLRMIGVGQSNTVAKVGSEKISIQDLNQQIAQALSIIQFETGQRLEPEQIRLLGLDRQALDTLIQQKLIDLETRKLKMSVTDEFIANEIRNQTIFKDQNGQFSKQTFLARIQQLGYRGERDYVQARKAEISRARLASALSGTATLPSNAIDPLYSWENQVRKGLGVVINHRKIKVETPTEDQLRDFFGANRGRFRIGEQRSFSALVVNTNQIKVDAKTAITDEDVQSIYEVEKDRRYRDVDPSTARESIRKELEENYIRDKALDIGRRIDDAFAEGQSLSDLAKDNGTFLTVKGATIGRANASMRTEEVSTQIEDDLLNALITMAFQNELDLLSPVEYLPTGDVALVYVEAIQEPRFPTYQEAEADVKEAFLEEQKIQAAKKLVQDLSDAVQDGRSLRAAGRENALQVIQIKANRQNSLAPTPYKMSSASLANYFAIPVGALALIPVQNKDGEPLQVLAVLESISMAKAPEGDKRRDFGNLLRNQLKSDILEVYLGYLRSSYPVEINEAIFREHQ